MSTWIFTKDKLPDELTGELASMYITCTRDGFVRPMLWYNGWNCLKKDRSRELSNDYIVAWMPFPAPVKEEQ